MEHTQLKELILETLKPDARLWNEDHTEFNQTLLLDLVENIDEKVIELLLQKEELRNKFFVRIKDVYVFKTNDFRFFMEENKVDNSYTRYKNRIGLTDGKRFLKDTNDIVLDFPYKDCILEGGQSTEEGYDTYYEYDETLTAAQKKEGLKEKTYNKKTAKRNEVFFNSILAHDEIDRLLDPKAFVNWEKYTKNGEQTFTHFTRDAEQNKKRGLPEDTITDNLIIKGNNLLALHSLKKEFVGKVKLIYIDPPYNTGNDGFKYNDSFNHSTWLTFMKNRLTIARDLLKNEGSIFISIDQKEISYLQILLDDIFDNQNFKNLITIRRSAISGPKVINPGVVNVSEYLLVYSKSNNWIFNRAYSRRHRDERYGIFIENIDDSFEKWKFIPLTEAFAKANNKELKVLKKELTETWDNELDNFVIENVNSIVQYANLDENSVSAKAVEFKIKSKENPNVVYKLEREGKEPYYIVNGKVILFYKDRVRYIDGKLSPSEPVSDIWTDVLPNDIHNEGGVDFRKGKKPEKLISRIIEIGTDEGEIVLDFHLGSGTSSAVAHKMGRQYIGIEQMDYGENDSIVRLKKVIDGTDDRGISKSVNWQGGGEFIFCEMAKWNESAKEKIKVCSSLEELVTLFDELSSKYFLNYNLKTKEFQEKVVKEEAFKALPLEEQKKIFIAMLDNNQLYVNASEMADSKYGISQQDQKLTNDFYQNK